MSNDLIDILSNDDEKIDYQKLVDYLNGDLGDAEKHEIERMMTNSQMINDAVEGLQHLRNKKNLGIYVEQLNKNLQHHLAQKRQQRKSKHLTQYPWIYFTIVLILLLCVVAFVIIRKSMNGGGF
ncbi:MAG TPA: hypothetical protein VKR32_09435 [Puia sp.]|nr:hypothetical protein [Puia sp.]